MERSQRTDPPPQTPVIRYSLPSYSESATEQKYGSANTWFAERFPEAAATWGPAFLEVVYRDGDMFQHTVAVEINQEFFAAVLGGRRVLGHRLLWYPPEGTWYFYEPKVDAFCPTTEPKLKLLLSNYLMRCAQDCGPLADVRPLVTIFKKQEILQGVIEKAKAMLEADRSFFEGKDGHRRMVEGKVIEANAEPTYRTFVKKGIVRDPGANLTVGTAFHRYFEFCKEHGQQPLTRSEFKDLVAEVIREQFNLGLRHDVPDERGKQSHGWAGIGCRVETRSVGMN